MVIVVPAVVGKEAKRGEEGLYTDIGALEGHHLTPARVPRPPQPLKYT